MSKKETKMHQSSLVEKRINEINAGPERSTIRKRRSLLFWRAFESFVYQYNKHRYYESLNNMTPADMSHGKQRQILS